MQNPTTFSAQDIIDKYQVSMTTLKRNFSQCQKSIEKKYGVRISKQGRGDNTYYYIEDFSHSDPSRALTLYESLETNLVPMDIAVGLLDLNFLTFIGIISSPQRSFRGSYIDLLKYIDIQATSADDIQKIKAVLQHLVDKQYIMYMEDPSDPMYFMAAVQKKTEEEMELEISAILSFQNMVKGTRKSWIPLMKVYFALCLLDQPCTIEELTNITKLTAYKVRDSLDILASHNVLIKARITKCDPVNKQFYCLGTQIDLNAFGL